MPARPAADRLMPLQLRVPESLLTQLKAEAAQRDVTLSDLVRSHIALEAVKPLGNPKPRRRQPVRLGTVSRADPALLRALASIGSNVNQLARRAYTEDAMTSVSLLVELRAIADSLREIGGSNAH